MSQAPFIMTNERLPGKVSAAILFTELGTAATERLLPYFSTKELRKLRKAIATLPPYNVANELQVLQRTEDYAKANGFFVAALRNPLLDELDADMYREKTFRERVGGTPEDVAQILGEWLSTE